MRPGHHRPLGTVARRWFPNETFDGYPPLLGDLVVEVSGPTSDDAETVRRAYLLVGIEEGPRRMTVLLERVEWGTEPAAFERYWAFYRVN